MLNLSEEEYDEEKFNIISKHLRSWQNDKIQSGKSTSAASAYSKGNRRRCRFHHLMMLLYISDLQLLPEKQDMIVFLIG